VIESQIQRGSNYQSNAQSRDQILDTIEDAVGKQTEQIISLFVTKDEFARKMAQIETYENLDERITEFAKLMEENMRKGGITPDHVPEKSEERQSVTSQPANIQSNSDITKYDTEIKAHIKSILRQYVSASDLHGLIHEVQRLSESHKHLTDEKYDAKNRIAILNKKVAQIEQVYYANSF